jgi:hypothetical protein
MSNENTTLDGGEPLNHGRAWKAEVSTRAPSESTHQENQAVDSGDTDREKQMMTTPSPAKQEPCEEEYPTGFRMAMIVVALVLGIFLVSLDMVCFGFLYTSKQRVFELLIFPPLEQTIVATAIPKITDEFGGLEEVSWYGSAFFLCIGGFQSTCRCRINHSGGST